MRESKAELTDRLRSEGRWDAFKKRREELKAGGMPAKDAWVEAVAEFPAPSQVSAEAAPPVDLSPLKGKPPVSPLESAEWTMEHLDANWITPADAPSGGAWSMLHWARSSLAARGEFYRYFGSKLLTKSVSDSRAKAMAQDPAAFSGVTAVVDEEDRRRMLKLLGGGDDDE